MKHRHFTPFYYKKPVLSIFLTLTLLCGISTASLAGPGSASPYGQNKTGPWTAMTEAETAEESEDQETETGEEMSPEASDETADPKEASDSDKTEETEDTESKDDSETPFEDDSLYETHAPLISVTTSSAYKKRVLQKEDDYITAVISMEDPDGSVLLKKADGKIKVRGNSTALAPKKPYTIKLGEKADLFGFGSAKKWVLLADCFDPTRMRSTLALDLAAALGLPYTPQHTMVELTWNGEYAGLYTLTEGIDVGKDRIPLDIEAGDFLLEYEKDREESGVTYIDTSDGLRFAFKEPETPDEEQLEHVSDVLEGLSEALESGSWAEVAARIDVPSFAAYYLLNEYLGNADFFVSSTYFFFKDGKLCAGPAWDYDMAAGNLSTEIDDNYAVHASPLGLHSSLGWYPVLMGYPQFRSAVHSLFTEKGSAFADLYKEGGAIDRFEEAYRAELIRDARLWPVSRSYDNGQRKPDPTREENVSYLREWLRERYAFLISAGL